MRNNKKKNKPFPLIAIELGLDASKGLDGFDVDSCLTLQKINKK